MNKYEFKGSQPTDWVIKETSARPDREAIAVFSGEWAVCDVYCDVPDLQDVFKPNAHLIAAAPELLQACIDVDDPTTSVAECLREIVKLIPAKETTWIKWCNNQADAIDLALDKALNLPTV